MGIVGFWGPEGPATSTLVPGSMPWEVRWLWPVVGNIFPSKNGGDFSRPRCKKMYDIYSFTYMNGDFGMVNVG